MIYFMRHGLDDESFVGGWSEVDLIDEGINQVNEALPILKKLIITKIYSSDIKRALSTAKIIASELKVPIIETDILREQNKGDCNGLNKKEAYSKYQKYIDGNDINMRYPNGESLMDLYERVKSNMHLLEGLDNVLIITHRGVINMLYYILNDIPLDMEKKRFGVVHASIHELDLTNNTIRRIDGSSGIWFNKR